MTDAVLSLQKVSKRYPLPGSSPLSPRYLWAAREVSLDVQKGETLGIVGESGCGKSTLARIIMGLEQPDSGDVYFHCQRLTHQSEKILRPLRRKYQMVFQDSTASLNPRRRVEDLIGAPMLAHRLTDRKHLAEEVARLLSLVGLPPEAAQRFPHEFSGGQRQRICLARALALQPELLILDEPVSALDVSVQAQILNLLKQLQQSLHLTSVFIGHNLATVRYVSTRIAVMYMGQIVEYAPTQELFDHPAHPYTRALMDAAPLADISLRDRPRMVLEGEASAQCSQEGCPFRSRCPKAGDRCASGTHPLREIFPGHFTACWQEVDV